MGRLGWRRLRAEHGQAGAREAPGPGSRTRPSGTREGLLRARPWRGVLETPSLEVLRLERGRALRAPGSFRATALSLQLTSSRKSGGRGWVPCDRDKHLPLLGPQFPYLKHEGVPKNHLHGFT